MSEFKEEITFGPVDKMTVGLLRIIHRQSLPIHYHKHIYKIFAEGKEAHGYLAYMNNDVAVGEVCARIEIDEKTKEKKLYLMTIGVLKTYQHKGIATKLLNKMIEESKGCKEVYLHVLSTNEAAKAFYKKNGFVEKTFLPHYYKALEMGDAYIYSKRLED